MAMVHQPRSIAELRAIVGDKGRDLGDAELERLDAVTTKLLWFVESTFDDQRTGEAARQRAANDAIEQAHRAAPPKARKRRAG